MNFINKLYLPLVIYQVHINTDLNPILTNLIKKIKTYLEKKGLLSGKIEEYTQNWENEKTENIYKISSFIHQTEPYMVENEINKARNIYISNIFYFSKEISGIVVELTRTMQRYNEGKRLVRKGFPKNDSEMEAEIKRLRDLWTTLDSLKEKYLNTIQTEIRNSIGEK